jgi:hypothetical protein
MNNLLKFGDMLQVRDERDDLYGAIGKLMSTFTRFDKSKIAICDFGGMGIQAMPLSKLEIMEPIEEGVR